MEYFKEILKDTKIYSILVILTIIGAVILTETLISLFKVEFSFGLSLSSFVATHIVILFATYIYAIHREREIEMGGIDGKLVSA